MKTQEICSYCGNIQEVEGIKEKCNKCRHIIVACNGCMMVFGADNTDCRFCRYGRMSNKLNAKLNG